jgi:hypothetical protein
MEQPSPSNERLSSISLVNVDDFHSNCQEMTNRTCRIRQNNLINKISILPLVISATGIVPQSLFKNLKILDLDNTLVVEIQKGILLYSCHIVRKFLNIDTEHNTQQSQNAEARRR